MLDHLPRDALQAGQDEQDLPEAAARVVLPVVDVVLQVDLHLVAHRLDLARVADAPRVCARNEVKHAVTIRQKSIL